MVQLNPFAISGILTAVTFFPLFIFIYAKGQTKVAKLFAFHCFCVTGWGVGAFLVAIEKNPVVALELWKWVYFFPLFIPVSLMHCIAEMINLRYKKIILGFCYAQAVFFVFASLSGWLSDGLRVKFGMYFFNGDYRLWISFFIWEGIVSGAHTMLIWYYWKSHPEKRQQLIFLIAAMVIGFFGGTMNFLPGLGFDIYPVGNFLVPVYSIMVAYAILQYQLLDISFVLRKGVIYASLIIIISTLYFFTFLLCRPVIAGLVGVENQSVVPGIIAAIFLTFFYAPLRLKIEDFVDATLFRGYNEEITRQNQMMEQELIRSEKFKVASEVMRSVVYQIRNPLTTIKTRSVLILQKLENREFIEKSAKTIDEQVEKVNELLHQLLKFSNPSAPKMEQYSIYNVIEDVITILNREFMENNIELKKDFHTSENQLLRLDPVQLRQALYNIMSFSVHSMPNGGSLSVSTNIQEKMGLGLQGTFQNYFSLEISDTGRGIGNEDLPRIFDPFHAKEASEEKIDLGLSTAHRIIKEHGGVIDVKSTLDKGTKFSIFIPITIRKEASANV